MPTLYFGSRGGVYYNKHGRRNYVNESEFGRIWKSKKQKEEIEKLIGEIISITGKESQNSFIPSVIRTIRHNMEKNTDLGHEVNQLKNILKDLNLRQNPIL